LREARLISDNRFRFRPEGDTRGLRVHSRITLSGLIGISACTMQ